MEKDSLLDNYCWCSVCKMRYPINQCKKLDESPPKSSVVAKRPRYQIYLIAFGTIVLASIVYGFVLAFAPYTSNILQGLRMVPSALLFLARTEYLGFSMNYFTMVMFTALTILYLGVGDYLWNHWRDDNCQLFSKMTPHYIKLMIAQFGLAIYLFLGTVYAGLEMQMLLAWSLGIFTAISLFTIPLVAIVIDDRIGANGYG